MSEKSFFEMVQDRLREDEIPMIASSESEPPPDTHTQPEATESTPERLCFELNANRPDGERATPKDFIPAGRIVSYCSPLFGDLEAEVLDDRGECLWVWNPIRECEASIPRSWLTGIVETPTGKDRET